MTIYDEHHGRGHTEVGGYNSPAGSQADMERQRREAAERQQREADDHHRAAEAENERRRADARREQEARERHRNQVARPAAASRAKPTKAPTTETRPVAKAKPKAWSTPIAVLAFFVVGFLASRYGEGNDRWLLWALVGSLSGYIAGRFYKALVVVGVLATAAWIWTLSQH